MRSLGSLVEVWDVRQPDRAMLQVEATSASDARQRKELEAQITTAHTAYLQYSQTASGDFEDAIDSFETETAAALERVAKGLRRSRRSLESAKAWIRGRHVLQAEEDGVLPGWLPEERGALQSKGPAFHLWHL